MNTIARYKYGYVCDEWGMNRSLGLIPDAAGSVCNFTDVEALQARVAELEYLDTQRLSSLRQVEAERNAAQEVIETITKDQTWFEPKAARDALQARVAELEGQVSLLSESNTGRLQRERDSLAAELAAARAQEPVAHRYKFTHPISGEPVWRDSSPTWNGQCVQEVQPLFAAPVPPVREPLRPWQYNQIPALSAIPPSQYENVVRGIEAAHGIGVAK